MSKGNEDASSPGRVTLSSGYNFAKLDLGAPATSKGDSDDGGTDTDTLNGSDCCGVWPVDKQIDLLLSMTDLKPVGCLRHWRVILICERMTQLRKNQTAPVTPSQLWPFLHEFYESNCVERHLSDNGPFSSSKVKDFDPLAKSEEMTKMLQAKVKQVALSAAKEKEASSQQKLTTPNSASAAGGTRIDASSEQTKSEDSEGSSSSQKEHTNESACITSSASKSNNPSFTPITKPNAPSQSASKRTSEVAALSQGNKSSEVETPRSKLRRR